MEKLKEKYDVILGFATLIISLSAFKDELAKIHLNLGFLTITMADYLLYIVYGFSICIYLYILENISHVFPLGKWKVWNLIINLGFLIFTAIILTPILVIIVVGLPKVYSIIYNSSIEQLNLYREKIVKCFSLAALIASFIISAKYVRNRRNKIYNKISEKEIIELGNANKLLVDGYYSQAILEIYKVLETHLYKKLTDKNIWVPKNDTEGIVEIALKNNVISENDLPAIRDLQNMRNVVAHTDIDFIMQQAELSFDFLKKLINRTEPKILGKPSFQLEITNGELVNENQYEFDIILTRTGENLLQLAGHQYGINIDPVFLNGGDLNCSIVPASSELENQSQLPTSIVFNKIVNSIVIAAPPAVGSGNGSIISVQGTRILRLRLANSNLFVGDNPIITWQQVNAAGKIRTLISAYVGNSNTALSTNSQNCFINL